MKLDGSVSLLVLPKLGSEPIRLKEEWKSVSALHNLASQRHLRVRVVGSQSCVTRGKAHTSLCSVASPVLQG